MFYTEEDLTPAVNLAADVFGRSGIRRTGNNIHNVSVATREFGKIWYGDIDARDIESLATSLSQRIRQRVYVFFSENNFDFNSAKVVFKSE